VPDARLGELVDLERLDRAQKAFADATELGAITVDNLGAPVIAAAHFSEFCKRMRADPVTSKLCRLCDAHGSCQAAINQRPYIYRCHAGLLDLSVALVVNGWYIGAILCGQALLVNRQGEPPPLVVQSTHWKADPHLREFYDAIPRITISKARGVADALYELSREATDGAIAHPHRRTTLLPIAPHPAAPVAPVAPSATEEAVRVTIDAVMSADLPGAIDAVTRALDAIWEAPLAQDRMMAIQHLHESLLDVAKDVRPERVARCRRASLTGRQHLLLDRWEAQVGTEALLDAIVTALEDNGGASDLTRLRNEVNRDLTVDLDFVQAADWLGMSPSHLSRTFRLATGMTFSAYKTDRRVKRAMLLLDRTAMPISEIAALVGFARPGYFARIFRARTGITPHEWRRQRPGTTPARGTTRATRPAPARPPR